MLHGLAAVGKKAFEITRCIHDRATTQPFPRASSPGKQGHKILDAGLHDSIYPRLLRRAGLPVYVWQVRDAESYRAEAVTQQLKDTTLPAVRGSIYSANGKLLAKSSTVWNIVADPSLPF